MSEEQRTASEESLRPVEEYEHELEQRPDDLAAQEGLVDALVWRHLYGESDGEGANEQADLDRAKAVVAQLSPEKCLYSRAYLAFAEGRNDFAPWLVKDASRTCHELATPFNSDELFVLLIIPFGFSQPMWGDIAAAFSEAWPESAAVLTLRGLALLLDDDTVGQAIDCFVLALDKSPDYWLAAWGCATAYERQKNWRAACHFYAEALKSEAAQHQDELHFCFAWCLGKIKDLAAEEEHYRLCLQIDPDYRYARNNLGWSLYKQGKYEEALTVLDEAIKRGNDGKAPIRNRTQVLIRLGRHQEALQVLRQDTKNGALTRYAERNIERIMKAPDKKGDRDQEKSLVLAQEMDDEALPEEEVNAQASEVAPETISSPSTVTAEQWLEGLLEEQIRKGLKTFNRDLAMYEGVRGYGRQFAIPGVGRIDLLAEDASTGELVVIELKRGMGDDQVVGQISRYMTWVRENLAKPGQGVWGIICSYRASQNLRLSAKNVAKLDIFEYGLALQKI